MTRHGWQIILSVMVLVSAKSLAGPLEDYVNAPDASYSYTINSSQEYTYLGVTYTQYDVRMYSQTWRSPAEVNHTLWSHKMIVAVPHAPLTDMGMLVVEGGFTGMWIPPVDLREIMAKIRAPFAMVLWVPNEPLTFSDETQERTEDEIISYSFDKYLRTGDPTWPALCPMVKAAVRAMDTVVNIAMTQHSVTVNRFCVGGASKRGWTSWLTAAIDPRVQACAPIVIDVLNMEEQINHHFDAYGHYTTAIAPYVNDRIFERFWLPRGQALEQMVDPYEYRDRLTMPKHIVCSPGDDYFLPDASHFYLPGLPGENLLRYVPNTGHSIGTESTVLTSIQNFFVEVSRGQTPPKITWGLQPDGALRVDVVRGYHNGVKLWQAYNPNARSFLYNEGLGILYSSTDLSEETPGSKTYVARVETPANGFRAWFVEVRFPGAPTLTTDVYIVPDVLPFKPNFRIIHVSPGGAYPLGSAVGMEVEIADNVEPVAYQWYKDGAPISGETQSTMSIPALSSGDVGYYACCIREGLRRPVFTGAIPISVETSGGRILVSPSGFIVEGQRVTLTAPEGTNHRFYRNSAGLDDDPPRVTGALERELVFDPVEVTDSGTYTCVYDNGAKAVVTTVPFELVVYEAGQVPVAGIVALSALLVSVVGTGILAFRTSRSRQARPVWHR